MDKDIEKKMGALDPKFREKISELFQNLNQSISLLYEAATKDEKTGLYNNKFFESILDMEIEKTRRGQENLSLFIIDIDFFKNINDKYGHIKADEILKKLAQILKKQLRKSDVAARFGGEEFFIILPATDIEKAKTMTSRLRTAIKNDRMLKKHGVTVSGGLTQFKPRDTKKKFKERADKALYKAKNAGRDRFVILE